jgi:cysteine desulfurase
MAQARKFSRIYLDYAATTPVDPAVRRAMQPYFSAKFGNPGSLHSFGQEAIAAVDRSRETIAHSIGAEFREVIFTASATEANNLALRGAIRTVLKKDEKIVGDNVRPRIIISAIEHESILETARDLERDSVEVIYLPVNQKGIVDFDHLKKSLNDRTVLVSIMYANNEIGSVQPIAEIAKIIRAYSTKIIFHTDAVQAFQFLDCNIKNLGVNLMTISSHKIYGPKGAGALSIRKGTMTSNNTEHIISGGGQEFGLRSGTENVPTIVGFAKAVELADAVREKESKRIAALRRTLWHGIKKVYPKAEINGGENAGDLSGKGHSAATLPNILNVYFPGHAAQDLLTRLDLAGLAVSSGSACRSRAMESSYVIEALGYSRERAKSSIRFSLGRPTTKAEIAATMKQKLKMY